MDLLEKATRRRAVDFALRLATGTALAPDSYELVLLEQYVLGQLSLPQLLELTEEYEGTKKGPCDEGRGASLVGEYSVADLQQP